MRAGTEDRGSLPTARQATATAGERRLQDRLGLGDGGGRVIVVDAIDDRAAGFSSFHGFLPVKDDPRRPVMKTAAARAALAASRPRPTIRCHGSGPTDEN
ncbi:hypothetical protein GCM10017559_67260 [Streptosporangium longisporum]|uniref:Uncharacterized protein n=1 Tax=Streptosporangium longisporum TaxID=46187 RepID=A0ABP6L4F1_9ACTN